MGPSLFGAIDGVIEGGGGDRGSASPAASSGLALLHSDSLKKEKEVGSFILRVPENGKVVKLTRVQGPRGQRKKLCQRGKIHGLSQGAALRLRRSMLSVNLAKVQCSFFVSNTIPLIGGAPEFGWADVRRFLRMYRQRFERRFPWASAHWVKELTSKGSPHLHLVVEWIAGTAPPSVDEFRAWNDNAWADVVRSSHPKHRDVGCNVKVLRSWEGAVNYLSCYLSVGSAEDPRTEDSGKMWGIIGRKNLPVDWLPEVELSEVEGKFCQRQLLHLQRKKRTYWMAATSTRSIPSSWGKPIEWRRVRADVRWKVGDVSSSILTDEQLAAAYGDGERASVVVLSVEQQLLNYKNWGFKVKRVVPSCCRRTKVPLWSSDVETGKIELTEQGEEIHSFSSGWHHVRSSEVLRLLEYVKHPPRRGLTSCERRWASEASVECGTIRGT